MKLLSTILIFVFLLSFTTSAQEKKNPIEGTCELTSANWEREDTTFTSPASPYDRVIVIYGKTHWAYVGQDTSRNVFMSLSGTYSVDGDNYTVTLKMAPNYKDIGTSFTHKFQIEGDQLTVISKDYHFGGYKWKGFDQVWKRID